MNTTSTKLCTSCGQTKSVTEFCKNGYRKKDGKLLYADGLQNYCKPCQHKASRKSYLKRKENDPDWYEKSKKISKERNFGYRLERWGLTVQEYESLAASGCAICGGPPKGCKRYSFDHDHKTGKFRGLLCSTCNSALGGFKDNPELLIKAAEYLKERS